MHSEFQLCSVRPRQSWVRHDYEVHTKLHQSLCILLCRKNGEEKHHLEHRQSNPGQRMKAGHIHIIMSSYSNAVKCGDLTSCSGSHQGTVISVLGKYFEWPSAYFPYLWHPDEYMYDTSGLPASSYIHNMHSCTLLLLQQQIWCSGFPGAKRIKELTQLRGWWHEEGRAESMGEGICHWQCSNTHPEPMKAVLPSARQLFSLLIKWRIWHLSWDTPLTVSDCHTPRADVSGCATRQISPRIGKQILSLPPVKCFCLL